MREWHKIALASFLSVFGSLLLAYFAIYTSVLRLEDAFKAETELINKDLQYQKSSLDKVTTNNSSLRTNQQVIIDMTNQHSYELDDINNRLAIIKEENKTITLLPN